MKDKKDFLNFYPSQKDQLHLEVLVDIRDALIEIKKEISKLIIPLD